MVGANFTDPGEGGDERTGLWTVLEGFGPSCASIQFIDVGPDDPDVLDPWELSPHCGLLSYG